MFLDDAVIKLLNKELNKGHISKFEYELILQWLQHNNLFAIKSILGVEMEEINKAFSDPRIQDLLISINKIFHERFYETKMLSLDDCIKWLSYSITNNYISDKDRLSPNDKLNAIKIIADIYKIKHLIQNDPTKINNYNYQQIQFQNLSISEIKGLLSDINSTKQQLTAQISPQTQTTQEINSYIIDKHQEDKKKGLKALKTTITSKTSTKTSS